MAAIVGEGGSTTTDEGRSIVLASILNPDDAESQYNLGLAYLCGEHGIPVDHREAERLLRLAMNLGHLLAPRTLAYMNFTGLYGIPSNYTVALRLYRLSAEQEDEESQFMVEHMFHEWDGMESDDPWHFWLATLQLRASKGGSLDRLERRDISVYTVDWRAAFRYCAVAADRDDQHAQLQLYKLHRQAALQNTNEMFVHVKNAVHLGYADELTPYMGTEDDSYSTAVVRYTRIVADLDDPSAQFLLSIMYREGRGVASDLTLSFRYCKQAADHGHAVAQYRLGRMYEKGDGIDRDAAEAARYYRMAADQGLAEAQYNLGCMYDEGDGIARNAAEAARYYRMAADQGDVIAQEQLGCMYNDDDGIDRAAGEVESYFCVPKPQQKKRRVA